MLFEKIAVAELVSAQELWKPIQEPHIIPVRVYQFLQSVAAAKKQSG